MIERYLTAASSYAGDIDRLVWLVTILVGFWFVVAEVMFFWLIFRFRARPGVPAEYITGREKHLKRWISWPHLLILACDVAIIVGAIRVWHKVKQTLPPPDATVRVTGSQWVWAFDHPGPDGILDTADDIRTTDELHVEVGKTYHFLLESKDVLHSFFVPVFRLKQDAVPGRTVTGWFQPTRAGTHDILCAEICGVGHGIMGARIFIERPEQHAAWIRANSTTLAAAAPDTASASADSN